MGLGPFPCLARKKRENSPGAEIIRLGTWNEVGLCACWECGSLTKERVAAALIAVFVGLFAVVAGRQTTFK